MFCRHCSLLFTSGLNLNVVLKVTFLVLICFLVVAVRPVPAEVNGQEVTCTHTSNWFLQKKPCGTCVPASCTPGPAGHQPLLSAAPLNWINPLICFYQHFASVSMWILQTAIPVKGQEGAETSARLSWMYFVTSAGSKGCAVPVEARPVQTLDTLQNTPWEGPALLKDRAGNCAANCCCRNWRYKSELFCIWEGVAVGLHVLDQCKNTWLLSYLYYMKSIVVLSPSEKVDTGSKREPCTVCPAWSPHRHSLQPCLHFSPLVSCLSDSHLKCCILWACVWWCSQGS